MASGSYTLDDLRRDRAAYEAEMAQHDEKRWSKRRAYFDALRKFPSQEGRLAAVFNKNSGDVERRAY